jgi:ribosome biogenesis protein MAK21
MGRSEKAQHRRRRGRSREKPSLDRRRSPDFKEHQNCIDKSVPTFHAPLIQFGEDASTWYEYGKDLPGRNDVISSSTSNAKMNLVTPELIRRYRSMADAIYQNELRLYNQRQGKKESADERWLENTMRKGTLKDRIAAMSVTLSTDPLHKFYALDGLLSMVGCSPAESGGSKPNSRVAQLTAEALEDLFVNTLLPPDRKLVSLAQRPLYQYENSSSSSNQQDEDGNRGSQSKSSSKKTLSPRILLLWRFEEMIKEKYDIYLHQYMTRTLHDGAEQQKVSTLQSAANLLSSVPEGESTLLSMMVNKLGDPDKKAAAAAGHQLRVVLQRHPNMQTVVAREVQQLAHRPHLSQRALYNSIVFLNQLQFRRPDTNSQSAEEGFNRQSTDHSSLPASLIKTYFRLFEVAVQNNTNSPSSNKKQSSLEDAVTVKSRLLSALLTGVNRAHPYLSETDKDMEEHVDSLYRIVHTAPPGACTQALMLLFHLAVGSHLDMDNEDGDGTHNKKRTDSDDQDQTFKEVRKRQQDRFYRALYATLAKSNLVSGGKHLTMYFNLLYKAMKYDTDTARVHAFSKRLLAAVMHAPPPSIAASLYLLQEISKTHESLRNAWEDVPDPESNASLVLDDLKREPKAAIVNMSQLNQHEKSREQEKKPAESHGTPPFWEVALLAHHFHPSISKFANDIGDIEYGGDPLLDFGLAPFLDKFAYRNPKSRDRLAVSSPHNRRMNMLHSRLQLPVNDPSFIERTDVTEQDEFFHRFFVERARRDELKGIKRHRDTKDDSSQASENDDHPGDSKHDQAFNAAEEAEIEGEGKKFEEYEAMWETDDEEEAFVDSLAVQLMEDAAGGPADIDDDPDDIDDWGDLYDDEETGDSDNEDIVQEEKLEHELQDTDSSDDEEENNCHMPTDIDKQVGDDEDAFMEVDDSEDESASESDEEPLIDESEILGDVDVDDQVEDDSENDDDLDVLLHDDESDDEQDDDISPKKNRGKTKKHDSLPAFADADEYEEIIEKSFGELKRSVPSHDDRAKEGAIDEPKSKSSKNKKKKSKRIKR